MEMRMPEIKTPITPDEEGNFLITDSHTISDIARWIINEGWGNEIAYIIDENRKSAREGKNG